jgi:hypothetical protein
LEGKNLPQQIQDRNKNKCPAGAKVRVEMPNPRDVLYRKMAGGWAHLDLADALKVMEKEKTFHIVTINKLLIVLIPVLIPDCLSNIYLIARSRNLL